MMEIGIFAGGCFWCIEAQFQLLKGVSKVVSGYCGGPLKDPTYEEVKSGKTDHFEVVCVTFDPSVIPYRKLLDIFFLIHDYRQKDGQGQDIGSQYRSGIFYTTAAQKEEASGKMGQLGGEVQTVLRPLEQFYEAEEYHQNYFLRKGAENPYCDIIPAKIAKLRKEFGEYIK